MNETILISGSYGHLTVDKESGKVLNYLIEIGATGEEYADIERFDLEEYSKYYGKVEDTDIILIGFWTKDGNYEGVIDAERQYRKDEAEMMSFSKENQMKLYETCRDFIRKHKISEAACISQTDSVIVDSYKFIEDICEVVGYYERPEQD